MNLTPRNKRNSGGDGEHPPPFFQQMHDSIESLDFLDLEGMEEYAGGKNISKKKQEAKDGEVSDRSTLAAVKQRFNSLSLSPRRKMSEKSLSKALSQSQGDRAAPKKLNPPSLDGSDNYAPKKTRRGGKRNTVDDISSNEGSGKGAEENNNKQRPTTPFGRREGSPAPEQAPKTPRTRSKMMAALRRSNSNDTHDGKAQAGFQQMHDSFESLDFLDLRDLEEYGGTQNNDTMKGSSHSVKEKKGGALSTIRQNLTNTFSPRLKPSNAESESMEYSTDLNTLTADCSEEVKGHKQSKERISNLTKEKRSITPFNRRSKKQESEENSHKQRKSKMGGLRSITPFRGRQQEEKEKISRPATTKSPSMRKMLSQRMPRKQLDGKKEQQTERSLPSSPSESASTYKVVPQAPNQSQTLARKQRSEMNVTNSYNTITSRETKSPREQSTVILDGSAPPTRHSKMSSLPKSEQQKHKDFGKTKVRRSRSVDEAGATECTRKSSTMENSTTPPESPRRRSKARCTRVNENTIDGSSHSLGHSSHSIRRSATPRKTSNIVRTPNPETSASCPIRATAQEMKQGSNTPLRRRRSANKRTQANDDDVSSTSSSTSSSSSSSDGSSVGRDARAQAFVQLSLGDNEAPTIKVRGARDADKAEVARALASMPAHQRPRVFNDMAWIDEARVSTPLRRSLSTGRGMQSTNEQSPTRQSLSGSTSLHTRSKSVGRSSGAAIHAAAALAPTTPRSRNRVLDRRSLGNLSDGESFLSRKSLNTRGTAGRGAAAARRSPVKVLPVEVITLGNKRTNEDAVQLQLSPITSL